MEVPAKIISSEHQYELKLYSLSRESGNIIWRFLTGEITIAIILLAIGVFLLPPVLKKLFGEKKKEPSIELQQQVKDEKRIYNEIKQGYYPQSIQNQGLQILESFNILSTIKSIDTLKGRYEFITGIDNPFFDYFNNLIKQKNPGTN